MIRLCALLLAALLCCNAAAAQSAHDLLAGETRGGKRFADFSISPYMGSYFLAINTKKFTNVRAAGTDEKLFLNPDGKPMPFYDGVVGGRSVGVPGTVARVRAWRPLVMFISRTSACG